MTDDQESESEQRYQQLIRTSPAPINIFDADGTIIWGNDAVIDLLGLESRQQLTGRSIFEFIDPDDHYTAKQELTEVVESKIPMGPTVMQLQRADGDIRDIRVATAPGRYHGQNVGQAVVIDVTAETEIQQALESERQFIEEALNTLQDVFYVINVAGDLERWNDALIEISGYTEDEVLDMDVEDFFIEAHMERVSESLSTVFAEGGDVVEATVRTKHDTKIPFEFRKRRLTDGDQVVGVVGIGRDISDRVAREDHLRVIDRLLQHTLRNQMNIIHGRAELLQKNGDADQAQHAEVIETAADRLLSIFDNHQHIVDLVSAQDELETQDIPDIVETVVQECQTAHPSAQISTEYPETATIAAVPVLDKAVRELIENAIEHNDTDEPRVELRVESNESSVSIACIDNGPVIPEMEYQSLQQTDSISPTSHTTGLGLWFVHWVIKRSNGHLKFDEAEPTGNIVTMEFETPQSRWE